MRLSKRLLKMMTKAMFQYFYVVWLISSLDFIAQCQCSQSANNQQQTSVKRNDTDDVQKQSRRYSDEAEIITSYTNLIGDDEPVEVDDDDSREKDFLYFNDPATISTPKYEPHLPPIPHLSPIDLPNNHKPIHQLERNPAYYPQMDPHLEPIPYDPEESFLDHAPVPPDSIPLHQPIDPTDHYNRPIDPTDHFNGPIDPTDHFNGPPPTDHSISNQLVKVIREPFWAPDFYKLEHRYMDTLRSIKDSFYTFYYKLQDMLYYVVNLFKMPEHTTIVGGEARGKKVKVKKKFKKFLLPLLIAYKLKFLALVPLLVGGLVLLTGATGMAGFFFALFAAVISFKGSDH